MRVYTWRWCCFLKILQADHLNQVNNGIELTSLYTTTLETKWLHEFLMDLLVVEKSILTILLNREKR